MIIGLTGKKQHGKDTVGGILVDEHGYTRLSFADALKVSAAALFDVSPGLWDDLKNDEDSTVEISTYTAEFSESNPDGRITLAELTVRQFLQRYGTEAHRDVFGESFWTDVIAAKIHRAIVDVLTPNIVVTDVRFDNEAEVIRRYGGIVVEVYRPQIVDAGDTHASEQTPKADMMLWNGDDIETLRQRVAQLEREGWKAMIV